MDVEIYQIQQRYGYDTLILLDQKTRMKNQKVYESQSQKLYHLSLSEKT